MPLNPKRHRLHALKQEESVEGCQRRASVALTDCATTRHVSSFLEVFGVDEIVITGFGFREHVPTIRIFGPRKFTRIYNHSTDRSAMTAHEFRHGMDDDVGAIFKRSQKNRRGNCVVNNEGNAVLMSDTGDAFDVCDIARGVTDTLAIDSPSLVVDQFFDVFRKVSWGEAATDAALGRMCWIKVYVAP